MNYWYSLSLGDGVMAPTPADEIQERFRHSFTAAGEPPGMAVFTRPESEGRLYCEIMAYFSPATAEVAQAFGARPCPKPERSGLGLLCGDPRAWTVLFGESERG